MYIPTAFAETNPEKLHDFIEAHSFGILVSALGGEPFATHLPLLLERDVAPHGALVGHVARANPHWRELDGQQVLAIFHGPHTYVSPSWYESDNVVPTWNYVAVHAYGTCRVMDEAEAVARIVATMVKTYERAMPAPWTPDTATDYFQKQLRAIVGLRIEIDRLEGKWKLNQNQPEERRAKVANVLEKSQDQDATAVARFMREAGA